MNPLDWPGPAFLGFYTALGLVLLKSASWLRRRREGGPATGLPRDPYLIAFLRGGKNELLRLCVLTLCDRGLLRRCGTESRPDLLVRERDDAAALVRRPIERAVLTFFATPRGAAEVLHDRALVDSGAPFELELLGEGMLVDFEGVGRRFWLLAPFLLLHLGVGFARLYVAAQRGRTSVGFLFGLMVLFSLLFCWRLTRRQTIRGAAALSELRTLFSGLRDRKDTLAPGGRTAELSLLVAVFGLGALPDALAWARSLYPTAAGQQGDSVDGAGCGSSCGSACGGGGCGGGCGGCGG